MDYVYIRYFGQIIKFKLEDYQNFIEHLVRFREMEGIEDKYPPGFIAWYKDEFDIEEIEYPMDGAFRAFTDHRNDGVFEIVSADKFEQLYNDRITELSKTQLRQFKQEEVLADDNQPMLKHLGLELLAGFDPRRIIELKLPCNDDLEVDYRDMKNLGYRSGDRHTEKMARRIQFWRTYALSMAPDDRKVKLQQKLEQRPSILYGKSGGRPLIDITAEQVDTAIKLASQEIKLPSSKNTKIGRTRVFDAIANEVNILTGAKKAKFNTWLKGNKISRDDLYNKMPDHIRSRMK